MVWFVDDVVGCSQVDGLISDEAHRVKELFGRDKTPAMLSAMIVHIFTPLAENITSCLRNCTSPTSVNAAHAAVEEFCKRIAVPTLGCEVVERQRMLRSVFASFEAFLEDYAALETTTIRGGLDEIINTLLLNSNADRDQDFLVTTRSLAMSSERVEALEGFADKLLFAVDSLKSPLVDAVRRSSYYLGGLRLRTVLRSLVSCLLQFTKQLQGRVEDVRVLVGLASDISTGTSSFSRSTKVGGKSSAVDLSIDGKGEGVVVDVGFSVRYAELGLAGMRSLVPGALRILQAGGRLSRRVGELESVCSEAMIEALSTLINVIDNNFESSPRNEKTSFPNAVLAAAEILMNDTVLLSEVRGVLTVNSRGGTGAIGAATSATAQSILASVAAGLTRFKAVAGSFLFDLLMLLPTAALQALSGDEIWFTGPLSKGTYKSDEFENSVNFDSILPLNAITQVRYLPTVC